MLRNTYTNAIFLCMMLLCVCVCLSGDDQHKLKYKTLSRVKVVFKEGSTMGPSWLEAILFLTGSELKQVPAFYYSSYSFLGLTNNNNKKV